MRTIMSILMMVAFIARGRKNLVVVVNLKFGPALDGLVEGLVPIQGPSLQREFPRQRP